MKKILAVLTVGIAAVLAGCTSQADNASKNLSKQAEKFQVVRRITVINGITDKVETMVIGRCSLEGTTLSDIRALEITCKEAPGQYKKHFIGLSDNMSFISTQLKSVNVSEFRTKIVLNPRGIVPDLDLAK